MKERKGKGKNTANGKARDTPGEAIEKKKKKKKKAEVRVRQRSKI